MKNIVIVLIVIGCVSSLAYCQDNDHQNNRLFDGMDAIEISHSFYTNEYHQFSLTDTYYKTEKLTTIIDPVFGVTFMYNKITKKFDVSSNIIFDVLYKLKFYRNILFLPFVFSNLKIRSELINNSCIVFGQKTDYYLFRKKPKITTKTVIGVDYINKYFTTALEGSYSWVSPFYSNDFQVTLIVGVKIDESYKLSRIFVND